MIEITNITPSKEGIIIEYLVNQIRISTLIKDTSLTPQQMIEKGFSELKPHLQIECDRLGISLDTQLPTVIDEIISVEILGVNDYQFVENQQPIETFLRCTGHTKFKKAIDLRNEAIFTVESTDAGITIEGNTMTISPTSSCTAKVTATYQGLSDSKEFSIQYTTLAEIEDRNAQAVIAEEQRKLAELEIQKPIKIKQSKEMLYIYLENNPLLYSDGKYYSVTQEKQNLLNSALAVYQMKIQAGLPAEIKWNSTGEECIVWTIEDITGLALAIASYVEPLVSYQQSKEVSIKNATTLEELNGIVIDYGALA